MQRREGATVVGHDGPTPVHMAYTDCGDLDSPLTLLLLHGLFDHRGTWSQMTPTLVAAGLRVVTVDLIGYGDSSRAAFDDVAPSERYSLDMHVTFLRRFMQEHLPFWEMEPADWLVQNETGHEGGAEVFRKHNQVYAIFYPDVNGTGTIDLSSTNGTFTQRWYDPKEGRFHGDPKEVQGGGVVPVGIPGTGGVNKDWVVLLKK